MSELFINSTSDQFRQEASHTLFVEGNKNSIDLTAIETLLKVNDLSAITVKALGSSTQIGQVAAALQEHQPTYYFLVTVITVNRIL